MTYNRAYWDKGAHTSINDYMVAAEEQKADCAEIWLNTKHWTDQETS
jgi:hypothetical protein